MTICKIECFSLHIESVHFISKIQPLDQISVNILHYGLQIFSFVRKETFISKSMFLYRTSVITACLPE